MRELFGKSIGRRIAFVLSILFFMLAYADVISLFRHHNAVKLDTVVVALWGALSIYDYAKMDFRNWSVWKNRREILINSAFYIGIFLAIFVYYKYQQDEQKRLVYQKKHALLLKKRAESKPYLNCVRSVKKKTLRAPNSYDRIVGIEKCDRFLL